MIRLPPGTIVLEPAEADYVGRALELLAQLLAEQRSQPSARLTAVTAKLRKTSESAHASARTASTTASLRAPQRDCVDDPLHVMGTGDAARILGISPNAVRDLARRGRIPARHTGTRWVCDAAAVIARAEHRAAQHDR